jgi:hypothetical protein
MSDPVPPDELPTLEQRREDVPVGADWRGMVVSTLR